MNFMTENLHNQFEKLKGKIVVRKHLHFNLYQSSTIYENFGQNIINITVVKLFSLTLKLPTYIPFKIATFNKYVHHFSKALPLLFKLAAVCLLLTLTLDTL